jgi:hypothetical protein
MAKKMNVDFKKILLEKGERIGLGVAVGFMALLLILGAWSGLGKQSPLGQLKSKTKSLNDKMASSRFDPVKYPKPEGAKMTKGDDLDPKATKVEDWFGRQSPENTKKRNPPILALKAYQVQYLRVPVRVIEKDDKQVQVIAAKGAQPNVMEPAFAEKIRPTRMVVISATFPYKEQLDLYRLALRAAKPEDLKQFPQFLGLVVYRRTTLPDGKVKMWKFEGDKDTEWETIIGQDPTKEPLPAFHGLLSVAPAIQEDDAKQREYLMPGLAMPRPALTSAAVYPALKMPKPGKGEPAIPDGTEPKPAPEQPAPGGMEGDQVVSANLDDLPEDYKTWLAGSGVNIFDPFTTPFHKKGKEVVETTGRFKHDVALCRFIDIDVLPGHTYDYAIVIRAANPNHGKFEEVAAEAFAKPAELLSPYNYVPRVEIPWDVNLYVADELAMDRLYNKESAMVGGELGRAGVEGTEEQRRVAVQIHAWVDKVRSQPLSPIFDLGEWVVDERLLVHRGEFIGKRIQVDVPKWDPASRRYFLALHVAKEKGEKVKRNKNDKGMLVDFAVKTQPRLPPALLVDFTGGQLRDMAVGFSPPPAKVKVLPNDESAAEILILTPEGKLDVRNGVTDTDPQLPVGRTRLERYEAYRDRILKLKPKKEDKNDNDPFKRPGK